MLHLEALLTPPCVESWSFTLNLTGCILTPYCHLNVLHLGTYTSTYFTWNRTHTSACCMKLCSHFLMVHLENILCHLCLCIFMINTFTSTSCTVIYTPLMMYHKNHTKFTKTCILKAKIVANHLKLECATIFRHSKDLNSNNQLVEMLCFKYIWYKMWHSFPICVHII